MALDDAARVERTVVTDRDERPLDQAGAVVEDPTTDLHTQ
jgi:hypothetical protein